VGLKEIEIQNEENSKDKDSTSLEIKDHKI